MIHSMLSKLGTGSSYAKEQKLQDAVERGNIRKVAKLIESGVSVNAKYVVSSDCTCTQRILFLVLLLTSETE